MTDWHGSRHRLAKSFFKPARGLISDFGIKHNVEIRRAKPGDISRSRAHRRSDIHINAKRAKQARDFNHIIAVAETKCRATKDIGQRAAAGRDF